MFTSQPEFQENLLEYLMI